MVPSVHTLAATFADTIASGQGAGVGLTMAQIQGHLLRYKNDATTAVEQTHELVEAARQQCKASSSTGDKSDGRRAAGCSSEASNIEGSGHGSDDTFDVVDGNV